VGTVMDVWIPWKHSWVSEKMTLLEDGPELWC
jgi:hypothetical protein